MSLYELQGKSGRFEEEKNLLPFPRIERFSPPITQSLHQLSYTGSKLSMMEKFLQNAIGERDLRFQETANSLPSLSTPSIGSWMLWASCIQSPTLQLYHKCISSPAKRHSSSPIAAVCVQLPEGPTQTPSYPGWLYNPVPFLRGLSLREEQNRRLEGRDSSSACHKVGSTASSGQAVRNIDRVSTVLWGLG